MNRRPRPSRRGPLLALGFVGVIAALLVLAEEAFARAGGGQSYSGGSSRRGSGGGSGGGGDGVFELIFWVIRLIIYYPQIGLPVAGLVVAFFVYAYFTGRDKYQTSVIRRGSGLADLPRRHAELNALHDQDPAFDDAVFLGRVRSAFLKVQDAWARQDLKPVRPFVSDGIFERFTLQFEEQRAFGFRNAMENVTVLNAQVAQVSADAIFQEVAVRIHARARDYQVSLKDGRRLRDGDASGEFVEVWSFLRKQGAKTAGRDGLIEGNCPNCGAGLEMNQNANCAHCGALLRSGQFDWVLAEITQECEWTARRAASLPGVEAVQNDDPGFSVQALEDEASVIFWRRLSADRLGKVSPLRKVATAQFANAYAAELKQRAAAGAGTWWFYADCGVGSVETRGIFTDEAGQHAVVEVRWSGTRFTARPGEAPQPQEKLTLAKMLLVLYRKAGVTANSDAVVSSAHCPGCGAPERGGSSGACEFCGAVLNDGSKGWVLEAIPDGLEATEVLRRLHDIPAAPIPLAPIGSVRPMNGNGNGAVPPAGLGLMAWMVKLVLADGHIDPAERKMLEQAAARQRVPANRLNELLAQAEQGGLEPPQPANDDEARAWLGAMVTAALADGKLENSEVALLRSAGQGCGLGDHDLKQLIKQKRSELYAAARGGLRESKRNGKATNGKRLPGG